MADIDPNEKAYRLQAGGSPFIILEPHHGQRTDITRLRRPELERFLTRAYAHVNPELEQAQDARLVISYRLPGQEHAIDGLLRDYRFAGTNERGQAKFAYDMVAKNGRPLGTGEDREWPMRVLNHLSYTNSSHFLCLPADHKFLRGAHYQAARHLVRTGAFDL